MSDSWVSASAGSSNPFRRKSRSAAVVSASATNVTNTNPESLDLPPQHPNASDFFRQQLQALPPTSEPPPSTTFQKPKIVKKVRVQSPPPSSPESASAPHEYPAYGYPDDDSEGSSSSSEDEEPEDPFRGNAPPLGVIANANSRSPDNAHIVSSRAPPNPFTKTLEDMEYGTNHTPQLPTPSAGGKGALDVDAFKRLLMTGEAPMSGPVPSSAVSGTSNHNPHTQADAASITDASSVSRQSIFDTAAAQETPRTSHEISEAEGEEHRRGLVQQHQTKTQQTASTLRKKPPPPSSRHGKLIRVDLSKTETDMSLGPDGVPGPSSSSNQMTGSPDSTSSRRPPSTPSDVNKPLPPAPIRRSIDESSESIFDREAAGKIPEAVDPELEADVIATPRPPTPPNASHATTADRAPADPRKPPPPPRRKSHSRTESTLSKAPVPSLPSFAEELSLQRRSSQDSTRSRSSSLRVSIHAPAPPPPRRPNHASRPSFTSPSGAGFMGVTPPNTSTAASPAASDRENPLFHGPVPLTASPVPASPGPTSLDTSSATTAASVLSPGTGKTTMSPPPLPPARNASVRTAGARPASLKGIDATSRRVKEGNTIGSAAPPPPPPPKRSRAGSGRDRAALPGGPVSEEPEPTPGAPDDSSVVRTSEDKSAGDILADLNELQREVDALRGQYEKRPASGV